MPRGIVFSKNEVFYEKAVNNLCIKQRIIYVEKTMNNFLNSEQKIIYAEKRVNNFVNNAKQKIILCKMLEIVYT